MNKVIITGATGFLGRHAIERFLIANWQVIALGRDLQKLNQLRQRYASTYPGQITFQQVDLTNEREVLSVFSSTDVVVHCAALSSAWGDKVSFYQHNVLATQHVVNACNKFSIGKLIYISSPSVYFDYQDELLINEDKPLAHKFVNTYAESKYQGEQVVKNHSLGAWSILRPRGIFGEHDNAIMPRLLKLARKQALPLLNGGQAQIDITYVKNVAEAIYLAAMQSSANGETFNISNGEPLTIKALLDKVLIALDMPLRYRYLPYQLIDKLVAIREYFCQRFTKSEPSLTRYTLNLLAKSQTLDINKAQKLLGYQPIFTVDEGIEAYAKWQQQHAIA